MTYADLRHTRWVYWLAAALMLTLGCAGEVNQEPADSCVPGRSVSCLCTGDVEGARVCSAEGAYLACECPDGEEPVDTQPDAGEPDARQEDASSPDAGVGDAGREDIDNADADDGDTGSNPSFENEVTLPVEVLGVDGTVKSVEVFVDEPDAVEELYLKAYSIGYPYHVADMRGYQTDKASVRLNAGNWVDINNTTVSCLEPEASARCVDGPMHTIRFVLPLSEMGTLDQGANSLEFRFNYANPDGKLGSVSIGYRVLNIELRDEDGYDRITGTEFVWDEPANWRAPAGFGNDQSRLEGKQYWESRNSLVESWGGETIKASCADCHTQTGYDLQYFAFSNESIIERSKFHGLSEDASKKVAAYIRSIELESEDGTRYSAPGRPWHPPYQPGPTAVSTRAEDSSRTDGKPFSQIDPVFWAAGAGVEWALDHDRETRDYLFPNGVEYSGHVEIDAALNMRALPVALQMPDWNEWLPEHHPMDVWGSDFEQTAAWSRYTNGVPDALSSSDPIKIAQAAKGLWKDLQQSGFQKNPPTPSAPLEDEITRQVSSKWSLVKTWELLHVNHYENDAQGLYGSAAEPLQWLSDSRVVFDQAPHIIDGKGSGVMDGYHDTVWYHLQVVINSGAGVATGLKPVDWKYHFMHIGAEGPAGGDHAWRYAASYIRLLQNANALDSDYSTHEPAGWYMRHTTPSIMDRQHTWAGGPLDGFSDDEYADVLDVILRGWVDGVTAHPLGEWSRQEGQPGLEPESYVPTDLGGNFVHRGEKTMYADQIYTSSQHFIDYGVDTQIMSELIAWAKQMWPNASDPTWDEILNQAN